MVGNQRFRKALSQRQRRFGEFDPVQGHEIGRKPVHAVRHFTAGKAVDESLRAF